MCLMAMRHTHSPVEWPGLGRVPKAPSGGPWEGPEQGLPGEVGQGATQQLVRNGVFSELAKY